MSLSWKPERAVQFIASTPPGGGTDRTARTVAKALLATGLMEVPIEVVNVPGEGGGKARKYLEQFAGDPHVLITAAPNQTALAMVGDGGGAVKSLQPTPLAILYTEYILFIARTGGAIASGRDLLDALRKNPGLPVGLSTSLGSPNHIAMALVARRAGLASSQLQISVRDSAAYVVDDVLAGKVEVGAITAASGLDAMEARTARAIAVAAPARLGGVLDAVPTWLELGVDTTLGAWRGVSGAPDIAPGPVAYWQKMLQAATKTPGWATDAEGFLWAPTAISGAELTRYLAQEPAQLHAVLSDLKL